MVEKIQESLGSPNPSPIREAISVTKKNLGVAKTTTSWKITFANFMVVWSVLSHSGPLIQGIKIYQDESSGDLSLLAYIIVYINSTLWLFYGLLVLDDVNTPIFLSGMVGLLVTSVILAGIVIYD